MTAVLIVLNILAGLFLIGVVLLQSGKGADMGAAFGGANSTVFGPSGPGNALTKATAVTAAVFMGTSLMLAIISGRQTSVFEGMPEPEPIAAPGIAPLDPPAPDAGAAGEDTAAAAPGVEAGTPASGDEAAAPGDEGATSPNAMEDAVKQAVQKAVDDAANAAAAGAAGQEGTTPPAAAEKAPAPGSAGGSGEDADPAQQPVDRMGAEQ